MAERDFDAERQQKEGHRFTLAGHTFHTYPGLSVTYILADDANEATLPLERTINFIRSLIIEEDRPKFDEIIHSPQVYIDTDDLLELSKWLVEIIAKSNETLEEANGQAPVPVEVTEG